MSIGDFDDTNNGGNRPPPHFGDVDDTNNGGNCPTPRFEDDALMKMAEAHRLQSKANLMQAEANRLQSLSNKAMTDSLRQQHEGESTTVVTPHENRGNTQHHPRATISTITSEGGGDLLSSPPKPSRNLSPDMLLPNTENGVDVSIYLFALSYHVILYLFRYINSLHLCILSFMYLGV